MFQIKYLEKPNCPEKTVKEVILGERYRKLFDCFFQERDILPIYIPDNPYVAPDLAGHADLSVFHCGNDTFYMSPNLSGDNKLDNIQSNATTNYIASLSSTYPNDCGLNIAYNGTYLIYNPETANEDIVSFLTNKHSCIPIKVKQGYSKCSICFVNDTSIITGDPGIAKACRLNGLEILLINDSFIRLPGYDHGFIGGSAFKVSETEIAFTGTIPDKTIREQIELFLQERKIVAHYITEKTMIDVGGIIPITIKE